MQVTVTVDRIEGDLAVLEVAGTFVDWPVSALPPGVSEGQRLAIAFTVEGADTAAAEERLARLRARGPKGDEIDL